MVTTKPIRVSDKIIKFLKKNKGYDRESYNEVLERVLRLEDL